MEYSIIQYMTYNCINRCFEHHEWKLITFSITIYEQGTVHLWIKNVYVCCLVDESKTALLFLQGSFQKNYLMSYILKNLSSFDQMKRNMQLKNS